MIPALQSLTLGEWFCDPGSSMNAEVRLIHDGGTYEEPSLASSPSSLGLSVGLLEGSAPVIPDRAGGSLAGKLSSKSCLLFAQTWQLL
jgi:hypothetical protein